ncbi:ATP-binding protein [Patescibacteria group bacterium]|nr:ATP-binding protein [Patescibacteria group bacterium]
MEQGANRPPVRLPPIPAQGKVQRTKRTNRHILHLKIAIISILTIFSPYLLSLLYPLTPQLLILTVFISAIISVILLFYLLKPLSNLVTSAESLSNGNFNQRVDIKSGDELEDVGNAFNFMADKLSKAFQRLEGEQHIAILENSKLNEILSSVIDGIIALDFNKNIIFLNKVSRELTGYNEAEVYGRPVDQVIHFLSEQEEILPKTYCRGNFNQTAKLIGKRGKQTKVNLITTQVGTAIQTNLSCIVILHDLSREEELEQMKLDFVSMASHELKTPLTSIIGYLSVFLNETKDKIPKDSLPLLDKAFIAAQQLQTLIANLLSVNKIEREQLSISLEPVDYFAILSKAIEDLRNQANQKNIVLSLITPGKNLPKILADPIRLGEVITNLLSNAINYTNPGGKVEITVKISLTEVTTIVSDTGIGIPQEAMPHLFNKFFRVSSRLQKANKGTGLGLYITKSIIEKLRGRIWVQSEVGKGSRFFFTLPIIMQNTGILDTNKFISQAIQSGTLNY